MRIHSVEKINELKKLRVKGFSINELVEKLSIPKTTVWHHVHDIEVSPEGVLRIKTRQGGSVERKERDTKEAWQYSQRLLGGANRDLCIAAAMLYWGEGSKKVCEFINSDGRMIKIYLLFLRNVLKISEKFIKPTMRIYTGMDRRDCLNYWVKVVGISEDKFIVRYNDGSTKGRTKYGMCRITVRKGSKTLKLMHSLMDRLFNEMAKE